MLSSALSHHNPMGTCRSNISVNGVAWRLGLAVDVRMMQRMAPVREHRRGAGWIAGEWMQRTLGDNYDRLMERRATWTPMRRNVTVEDVAETVFSLITSNPFVTGETIVIDGGYAATS